MSNPKFVLNAGFSKRHFQNGVPEQPAIFLNCCPGTDVMILKNIFSEKFGEKIGVFDSKQRKKCKILIITLFFSEKRHFFRQKMSKIAENCDHNIGPRLEEFSPIG
jgi:hypothetical protein